MQRLLGSLAMACAIGAAALSTACNADTTAGGASVLSGPPVMNPVFGARMPRQCKEVTHVPSAAEAAALVQCFHEKGGEAGAYRPMLYLWQNVDVRIGGSRSYAYNADSHNSSIDTTAKVYPIRVTGDQLSCTGQPTCLTRHADKAEGVCFKTTFGDWKCNFSQVFGVTDSAVAMPAPSTY